MLTHDHVASISRRIGQSLSQLWRQGSPAICCDVAVIGIVATAVAATPRGARATDLLSGDTVWIRVVDRESDAPVARAHVELAWATSSAIGSVGSESGTSDSLGIVKFGSVPRFEPVTITVQCSSLATLRVRRRVGIVRVLELRLRRRPPADPSDRNTDRRQGPPGPCLGPSVRNGPSVGAGPPGPRSEAAIGPSGCGRRALCAGLGTRSQGKRRELRSLRLARMRSARWGKGAASGDRKARRL